MKWTRAGSWALNGLGAVIAGWALFDFDPVPVSLVLCVIAPLTALALAAALPGSFSLFDDKRGTRGLYVLFAAPLGALIFIAAFEVQLLNLSSDLVPAASGALFGAATFGLWRWKFGSNWRTVPLSMLLGGVVACAAFELADVRLDHSPARTFRVTVADRQVLLLRGKATTKGYYLDLPAWGPQHDMGSVRVSSELFEKAPPGEDVCVVLHSGFLGAPWYTVNACSPALGR